jgi:hypothetical protein
VESGISITASSMATMRPLFVAFFSRSELFGSTPRTTTYPRNATRLGYFRKKENAEMDELELHSDFSKSILLSTVTKSESTRAGRNKEVGTTSSESERALNGEIKWVEDIETDNRKNVGQYTTIEGGTAV